MSTKISIFRNKNEKPIILTDKDDMSSSDILKIMKKIFTYGDDLKEISFNGGSETLYLPGKYIPDAVIVKSDKHKNIINNIDSVISDDTDEYELEDEDEIEYEDLIDDGCVSEEDSETYDEDTNNESNVEEFTHDQEKKLNKVENNEPDDNVVNANEPDVDYDNFDSVARANLMKKYKVGKI